MCFQKEEEKMIYFEKRYSFWKKSIIPNAKSDEEAINAYYAFYTPEEEKKFWVIAIQVNLLTK